ncbi:DUF1295 domain-containing protein [Aquincola tertiaricarbonis]|uniref:DUF1295 domain-containing protein n=1 Tax=Aquincola tertiaricarbonis TaxID=391953 RepID=UPI0006153CF7|nr:DUF1295 domain-containing protein [Aquincola tertiaricarbonis]
MTTLQVAAGGLAAAVVLAVLTWLASVVRHDVSLVDRVWSLMIVAVGLVFAWQLGATDPRTVAMLFIGALWALRLAAYISWRNWGHGEDRRYQAIRERNQPYFAVKSLYLVFGLQAVLAWIVALPFLAAALGALGNARDWEGLDTVGAAIAVAGLLFEAVADAQMAAFKARDANTGQVMDRGLWRHSRHPNYFGECCVWWGLGLMALAAGGWWALLSPLLMTVLLLKVSGVTLLEKDMHERRPGYRDYVARTNAFIPGPRKPPRPGA